MRQDRMASRWVKPGAQQWADSSAQPRPGHLGGQREEAGSSRGHARQQGSWPEDWPAAMDGMRNNPAALADPLLRKRHMGIQPDVPLR